MSSAYLRLLIFIPAVLIPACAYSSPAFLMMYSAYKLNKQCDNIQPWRTPFPIWNQSVVPCPVLNVASWPAYRFLKRQVRWSGIPISFRIFHSLLWSTPWKESYDQPRQRIKKQRHYFVNKGLSSRGYGFSSGHVWMWELDCEESWAPKNWRFWTVVLEKTLGESLGQQGDPTSPSRRR